MKMFDIIILFLPMGMNIKLTLMWLPQLVIIAGYYCGHNNQQIQIKNKTWEKVIKNKVSCIIFPCKNIQADRLF